MSRVVQPKGARGSLKWLQVAVNERSTVLDGAIPIDSQILWRSPLKDDNYAEYRDTEFLNLIGCRRLSSQLSSFWPKRGPQWDALAVTNRDEVLLVEAKAHIPELFSPPSSAGPASRAKIVAALDQTALYLGAKPAISWSQHFYQLANRLAHLMFLRENGVDAHLIFLNFVGDVEMNGPSTSDEWKAAYVVVEYVLGLPRIHKLTSFVHHAYLEVGRLENS